MSVGMTELQELFDIILRKDTGIGALLTEMVYLNLHEIDLDFLFQTLGLQFPHYLLMSFGQYKHRHLLFISNGALHKNLSCLRMVPRSVLEM